MTIANSAEQFGENAATDIPQIPEWWIVAIVPEGTYTYKFRAENLEEAMQLFVESHSYSEWYSRMTEFHAKRMEDKREW